jgi:hypothetical protein
MHDHIFNLTPRFVRVAGYEVGDAGIEAFAALDRTIPGEHESGPATGCLSCLHVDKAVTDDE